MEIAGVAGIERRRQIARYNRFPHHSMPRRSELVKPGVGVSVRIAPPGSRDLEATPATLMAGRLQSQLKQPGPFRSLEAEVFLNVLRTSSEFLAELVDVLRAHELTQPQYNVLRILRGAGDAGLPTGEIGTRMVSREPDVTRLLDRMEARGLVGRHRVSTDRRVVTARITDEGRRLADALDAPVAAMHARQLGHLSRDELATLNELLERARHGGA
jgi:DNA-binding MarR family transcriptional regulator